MKKRAKLKGYTWKTFLLEIIMLLLCCIIVLPFYYLVISIFKTPREMGMNPLGLPEALYLENFKNAWAQIHFIRAFCNTLILTFSTLVVVSTVTMMSSLTPALYLSADTSNSLGSTSGGAMLTSNAAVATGSLHPSAVCITTLI